MNVYYIALGSEVRRFLLLLGVMVTTASIAVAQPDSEAERIRCAGAAKDWAPVKLPAAGVNVAIPCNDGELGAYKSANEERKRTEGLGSGLN